MPFVDNKLACAIFDVQKIANLVACAVVGPVPEDNRSKVIKRYFFIFANLVFANMNKKLLIGAGVECHSGRKMCLLNICLSCSEFSRKRSEPRLLKIN